MTLFSSPFSKASNFTYPHQKRSVSKTMCFQKAPLLKASFFITVFGCFSVDDRPKRTKKYAKHISVVGALDEFFFPRSISPPGTRHLYLDAKNCDVLHRRTSDWLKLAREIKPRNNQPGPFHKSLISYVVTMELFD